MFNQEENKINNTNNTSTAHQGMVGTAEDGMVIEYDEEGHSSSTSAGGEGAVPEGGFKHEYTKHLGLKLINPNPTP